METTFCILKILYSKKAVYLDYLKVVIRDNTCMGHLCEVTSISSLHNTFFRMTSRTSNFCEEQTVFKSPEKPANDFLSLSGIMLAFKIGKKSGACLQHEIS